MWPFATADWYRSFPLCEFKIIRIICRLESLVIRELIAGTLVNQLSWDGGIAFIVYFACLSYSIVTTIAHDCLWFCILAFLGDQLVRINLNIMVEVQKRLVSLPCLVHINNLHRWLLRRVVSDTVTSNVLERFNRQAFSRNTILIYDFF